MDSNLSSIMIPKTVTDIYMFAFKNSKIAQVTFENDSEVNWIGIEAFANTELVSIELPQSLRYIDSRAFFATPLKRVIIFAKEPLIRLYPSVNGDLQMFFELEGIKIYVPETSISDYKAHEYYQKQKDNIYSINELNK